MSGLVSWRKLLVGLPAVGLAAVGALVADANGDASREAAAGIMAGAIAAGAIYASLGALYRSLIAPRLVALAAIHTGALLAHAPGLMTRDNGRDWLLLAILGTFAVDSAAYFIGRTIGRRKLAPKISPKKTWEGAAGGLVGGIAATIAANSIIGPGISTWQAAAIGASVAFAGTLGDLAESALKRVIGIKDSGALIPGHGGILDRIDSLAPNLAVVYWAAVWLGA